jgi:hypothetical protein
MHGPMNGKSPNNTSKWQMGFNSAFKGLNAELHPICHLLVFLGAHPIPHISRIRVNRKCERVCRLIKASPSIVDNVGLF